MTVEISSDAERIHDFTPRRVQFDHSAVPAHWVPGDPHTTHVVNVLHLLLPAGERWFCDVFRQALPRIDDEMLRRDVRAFIGQEATHARAHAAVLDHLEATGIDPRRFTRLVEWGFHQARPRQAWSWLPARLRAGLDQQQLLSQLAVIAAIEHFTAVLGWWIVVSRGLDRAGADPTMMRLLRWHGAEEVEHRSVAFDTYHAAGGGYLRRAVAMVGVVVAMAAAWVAGTGYFLRADPNITRGRFPSIRRFRRAARSGRLPIISDLLLAVPRYLSPRYHPSSEGRTQVALDHLAAAPLQLAERAS